MPHRPLLSLGRLLAVAGVGLVALSGLLLYVLTRLSQDAVSEGAAALATATGDRIEREVNGYVGEAPRAVDDVERRIQRGILGPGDVTAVQGELFAVLTGQPQLFEVSFTRGKCGNAQDDVQSWQAAALRETGGRLVTQRVEKRGDDWIQARTDHPKGQFFRPPPPVTATDSDPSDHPTFQTPASAEFAGSPLWTDIYYLQVDEALPENQRRAGLSVMRTVADIEGHCLGVVRAGLQTADLDTLVQPKRGDPVRVLLADGAGRLVARPDAADKLVETEDGELRVELADAPSEVYAALHEPLLARVGADLPRASTELAVNGYTWLAGYRTLPHGRGWRLVTLVAHDRIPGLQGVREALDWLVAATVLVVLVLLVAGLVTVRAMQRGLGEIGGTAKAMRSFDFAPREHRTAFRDVQATVDALERAKTAMRALGRYVPIDLVRQLLEANEEPALGGELREVTLMFTDIRGFTTLAERTQPKELAHLLGRYLEVATAAVHGAGGTVDKYIGDAVMALWNAPRPCEDHVLAACRGALAMHAALNRLYGSSEWQGRPKLETGVGLHTDRVMVGHFGARDRMSYTALGDGVNLASRLEGLNKLYGTRILVSAPVAEAAKAAGFVLWHVDRVAVKGRQGGIDVYELLGEERDVFLSQRDRAECYEAALAAYFAGNFAEALMLFDELDAPDVASRLLSDRCRKLADQAPAEWDGCWVATEK